MIKNLQFRAPKFQIRLSRRHTTVNVVLRAESGEEYSISGFPRPPLENEAASQRNTSTPTSIRRRPSWTAPDPQRFPSLDSLSLHSRVTSSSDGLRPARPRSPSSLYSGPEESHLSTTELDSISPPYELEAPSNHHNPRFQAAIQLQRERERIRSEEVAPLVGRIRDLEARHEELESRISQLQPQHIPKAVDTQDQNEAASRPVSGAGLSSSRERDRGGLTHTATVRYVGRNPRYSGDSSSQ